MEYLPSQPQRQAPPPQGVPASGAGKYHGDIAEGYDAKRVNHPKWTTEQKIIEELLSELPEGSTVLDCPVGTGRFLDVYKKKKITFIGADISGDMLIQSALKLVPQAKVEEWVAVCNKQNEIIPLRIKDKGALVIGDIRKIGLEDQSVDAAVMVRLTRGLSPDDCKVALKELQRVTKSRIIWTARVANHIHARSVELFESALDPDWKLTKNVPGYVLDYRILCAERTA